MHEMFGEREIYHAKSTFRLLVKLYLKREFIFIRNIFIRNNFASLKYKDLQCIEM